MVLNSSSVLTLVLELALLLVLLYYQQEADHSKDAGRPFKRSPRLLGTHLPEDAVKTRNQSVPPGEADLNIWLTIQTMLADEKQRH